ncbi:AMP-binding protein [Nitriliruptoria bacterium AS10]|nr:AMP-binding protein [Salsipaludibacter albus]
MERSLIDIEGRLGETAVRHPDRPAIVWQGRTVTYRELDARVDAAAADLQSGGIGVGDRVAIQVGNVPAFVEAYYATLRIGAVAVPLSTALAPDEVAHSLADSGASLFVVAGSVAAGMVDVALELDVPVVVAGDEAPQGVRRWSEVVAGDAVPDPVEVGDDDLAALVYTSGTTGRPRGAMLTRGNLRANQDQSLAGRFQITGEDVALIVLPLSHIYALNVGMGACVRVGATVVLQERFDPLGSLDAMTRNHVTILLGAPPMYVAWTTLPDLPTTAFADLRLAVSGAAPLPEHVLTAFLDRTGIMVEEGYGLTEASPSVTANSMAPEPRPGTVGHPLPGIELRLVELSGGDNPEDVATGDPGEVWVRGPNVFAGYHGDPEATAATLTDDGWLRTGDVGVLDRDGYLRLVDRNSDLVIVSGFNVYPQEVERVLEAHDAVAACAVVGIPHPYTGEAVKAFVVTDGEVTEDDLVGFCATRLARYKCPQTIEFVSALPHTASGKLRRVALRES